MNTKNEKISAWLESKVKNMDEGLALLKDAGFPELAERFARLNPQAALPRIQSHLQHALWLWSSNQHNAEVVTPSAPRPIKPTIPSKSQPEPQVISRAKSHLHELYLKIVEYHKRLLALGDDNSEATKSARVALMNERQPFLDAFSLLWDLKEDYFAYPEGQRKVPAELQPLLDNLEGKAAAPSPEQQSDITAQLASLSDLKLKEKRHAIRQQITRRQNKLRFQRNTPGDKLNPMPESPRRTKIENEIAELQAQLAIADQLIADRKI